jgi:hypothetical protein
MKCKCVGSQQDASDTLLKAREERRRKRVVVRIEEEEKGVNQKTTFTARQLQRNTRSRKYFTAGSLSLFLLRFLLLYYYYHRSSGG